MQKSFHELFIESVDEALSSLGEPAKSAIYFHIQRKFKISKEKIPDRFKEFAEGLEKIFGLGAKFIEMLIIKKLYERIGKPLELDENEEFDFVGCVEAARRCF